MARTVAELPKGVRITDHISLGVIAKTFPREVIEKVLEKTQRQSKRQRDLPAHVVVYYVIALALYMDVSYREVLRCLLEGISWLMGPGQSVRVTGKSGISQARTRLGAKAVKELHDEIVRPIAGEKTKGARYRSRRLISLDGSTMDVADTSANSAAFGRQKTAKGKCAYPKIRFVSLVECGTHVLYGSKLGPYDSSEAELAKEVIEHLQKGVLCLADRYYFGYQLWQRAMATGAQLLFRVRKNLLLPCSKRLEDGSYLSKIYPSERDKRRDERGVTVRVVEYTLDGVKDAEPLYRLVTSILDPNDAPAIDLAALYHERWEIETALDELKTHLRGPGIVLRSKTPELVKQEFYGLMMAHFAIRGLMHEAALSADADPDQLSFVHAVRVIRRRLPLFVLIPPSGPKIAS